MKASLILALAGLSAAAPAVVAVSSDDFSYLPLFTPKWPEATSPSTWIQRPAAHTDGEESSDDEDVQVPATLVVGSTRTSVTTFTKTQTQAAPTRTVTSPPQITTRTSVATTTKTQTSVTTAPAPTTTRTSVVTSTKTTPKATPTPSTSPDDSGLEDEADVSLDADLDEFMDLPLYSRVAQEEDTPCPYVKAFENQNATAIHQPIQTHPMITYDAKECSEFCNDHRACKAFSIFIERQPSCTNCSDPESTEVNMCELYNTLLERNIVRDNGTEANIRGKKFTRAVRASNGYNRLGQIQTITVTARASTAVETIYRTRTVTSPGQASTVTSTRGLVTTSTVHHTTTSHHTVSPVYTVVSVSSQPARTVTSTRTVYASPYTRTVTKTMYSGINMPTAYRTTTHTVTRTAAASPTTTTETTSASPVTRTVTRTSSASPTTRTVTRSVSASPTTHTVTSTRSASPKTATARQTVVVSISGSTGTVTQTSTKTSTKTTLKTTTKTTSAQPTTSVVVDYSSSEEESLAPQWE